MSTVPYCNDVLPADTEVLPLPAVAESLDIPVTRVHDLLRDGALIAVKREGITAVPARFFDDTGEIARFLPGLVSVLRDGGYGDEEILLWLFAADETLSGAPIDAIHGHLAREVMRRAQAMAM